jgi:hypothetical protein
MLLFYNKDSFNLHGTQSTNTKPIFRKVNKQHDYEKLSQIATIS